LNYWGDAAGPYNATMNPCSTGDGVEGNVDFSPWLDDMYPEGSPVDYADVTDISSGTSTVNAPGANTTVIIDSSGSNTVTILRYTGNPEGDIPSGAVAIGNFIDVSVENPASVNYPVYLQINYTAADLAAAGITEDELLGIAYWDAETGCWVLYADTGVNTTNFGSYEGYIWAYIYEGQFSPKVILGGTYSYPESHLTVTLDPNGYIIDASTFHIWATASSAWKIKYRIDGGEIKEGKWNEEVHFQLNKNWGYGPGKHTIEYWAVDPGTYEEEHHVEIYILDTNGPEVRISFDGVFEVTASNVYEISTSTKVMASGEDDESGLSKIEYKIDNGEWQEYTAPFTMPSGYHELYVIGYDMLGNIGNMMHYSIDVGGGKPETALVTTPSSPNGNNGWYVSNVMVKFVATDDGSGVAKTMYKIDNGEWQEYAEPFVLDDGVHEISYYSIDNVGNVEMERKTTIRIDMYAPEIHIEKPRNYLYLFNRAIIPLSKPVIIGKITFEAEIVDTATSGVNDAVLYIDGNVVEKGESKIQYTIDEIMVGRHTMKIVACDRAGNKAVMEDEFIILNIRAFPSLSS
ncbi:MAG: hypothetical protein J7K61_04085, partial [Thermoplasmata archaeon]|nr:hypothetical protein [Thermoplasmata archaeon]